MFYSFIIENLDGEIETIKFAWRRDARLLPPAYAVVDLLAHWSFARTGRLSVRILNLLDEKYWQWADVPVRNTQPIR